MDDFLAFRKLSILMSTNSLSPRSSTIATYAICGFSNPNAVGIGLAVLSSMCPERRTDFANVVVRAFFAGISASLLTACVAGTLSTD